MGYHFERRQQVEIPAARLDRDGRRPKRRGGGYLGSAARSSARNPGVSTSPHCAASMAIS